MAGCSRLLGDLGSGWSVRWWQYEARLHESEVPPYSVLYGAPSFSSSRAAFLPAILACKGAECRAHQWPQEGALDQLPVSLCPYGNRYCLSPTRPGGERMGSPSARPLSTDLVTRI